MGLVSETGLKKRNAYTYTWRTSQGDNPHITGPKDSDRVSRKEGYEVVHFINAYADKNKLTKMTDGDLLEDMLHAAPGVMRSDFNKWIKDNWGTWK